MFEGPLPPGKVPEGLLTELLAASPPWPDDVLVGPRVGEDACALSVGERVLVAATDPITLTGSDVGAHAVIINANDVAVMGVKPRWFLANVLLAPGATASDVRALFANMNDALGRVGAVLVGGHTEVSAAVNQNVVAGQMLGLAEPGGVVRTGSLRPGDRIVQVGPAPLEGAAILAADFRASLGALSEEVVRRAAAAMADPGISVVAPALLAAEQGAHSMHDPTEGGLSAGLYEMATASEVGLEIDSDAVLWFGPGRQICRELGLDPWGMLASGTLLAGFRPNLVGGALRSLLGQGHSAAVVAEAVPPNRGRCELTLGDGTNLPRFTRDELARFGDDS